VEKTMKFRIKQQNVNVDIEIEELEGRQKKLMHGFQERKEGRCSYPTTEFEKLDTLCFFVDFRKEAYKLG
jgi:5-hydroxyisourate hydrolase-like protein (transthyretin family)